MTDSRPTSTPQEHRQAALDYHEFPKPGKLALTSTKPLVNQHDLSLAYSPGVAAACEEIVRDPSTAYRYTARGNLIGVVTNGTAVLGLGAIGPEAAKPVMEGKSVLFKKFAGIDAFDIEIDEKDPDRLIEIIASLAPTFGGINLEDIRAPECFYIERKLRERLKIPVFHDDQHGTAIIVGAAVTNAAKVVGKSLDAMKLVVSGAGAAALACVDLLVDLGLPRRNVWLTDLAGVVYAGRTELMDEKKAEYAQPTPLRTLEEVLAGADIFLGLSAGGVLKPEWLSSMAPNPLIFALANPVPEIMPELARAARADAVIATGRSDYPNQVNNVLCFPYIFRGALDVGATTITREMEVAAVHAIAELAYQEQSDVVASAYGIKSVSFGRDYIIPKPFDPRLMTKIAPAVARAAMASGVASRPIRDFDAYKHQLQQFVYQSETLMKSLFTIARKIEPAHKRIAFAEGEDRRVLQAAQILADEGIARPVLVGRPQVIRERMSALGLKAQFHEQVEIVDTDNDPRYREYWQAYYELRKRDGVTQQYAKIEMRRRGTLIAAMMLRKGEVDGLICGTFPNTHRHLRYIDAVIGRRPGCSAYAAMNALILPGRQLFLVDTHVNIDPTAEELAEITVMAAATIRRFGIVPKVAMLSHSNFGSSEAPSALKMRAALARVRELAPELEVDGEMHGDTALDESVRRAILPDSTLSGSANLLVMPNIDAANISYNLLKTAAGNGVAIGPILLGCAGAAHILTPSTTVRRIVNMATLTVVEANADDRAPGG
jgi:malate dehydrogenase (oxaloacetate-decarboxylating)(NADP+)